MIDVDDLVERLRLEDYGVGVPFAFAATGLALLYGSVPGIGSLDQLTGYGRLGLTVMVAASVVALLAAGYTYNEIDRGWWVQLKDRDGPAADDADPLAEEGPDPAPEVEAE